MQRRVLQELRGGPLDPAVRRLDEFCAELLDQARFAEARLADDGDELAFAGASAIPAAHQHRDFLVAADKGGERALAGTSACAARPHDAEERDRLGRAFQRVLPTILRDEQAGDMALHPRGDHDRARLGESLDPGGDIGRVAKNLAGPIDHDGAGLDPDASGELRQAGAGVCAVEVGERALDCERGAHRALRIVLLRDRVAEQRHDPVAEFFRDMATHLPDRLGRRVEIAADEIAPVLGVERRGHARRSHEVAEHHRQMPPLRGFGRGGRGGFRRFGRR